MKIWKSGVESGKVKRGCVSLFTFTKVVEAATQMEGSDWS